MGSGDDGGGDESERRSSEWRSHVQQVGRLQMQSREMPQAGSTIVEAQRHTVDPAIASLSALPPFLLFVFWMSLL